MKTPQSGRHSTKAWMSRSEVARLLEVAPVTIGRWASEGKLPYAMTLGGRRRFRRDDVLQVVERLANVTPFRAPAERRRHR
jgi:excisionase family DNA binding protein